MTSAMDREILDLWRRRLENFRMAQKVSDDESDNFGELGCDCTHEINRRIRSSGLALGAVLLSRTRSRSRFPAFIALWFGRSVRSSSAPSLRTPTACGRGRGGVK